jgi:hypothetical protein
MKVCPFEKKKAATATTKRCRGKYNSGISEGYLTREAKDELLR